MFVWQHLAEGNEEVTHWLCPWATHTYTNFRHWYMCVWYVCCGLFNLHIRNTVYSTSSFSSSSNSFSMCDKILGAEDAQWKSPLFLFSQTVGGGSGHGQGDGRHGADESLHQPAGQESTCQSQRWVSQMLNNWLSGDVEYALNLAALNESLALMYHFLPPVFDKAEVLWKMNTLKKRCAA